MSTPASLTSIRLFGVSSGLSNSSFPLREDLKNGFRGAFGDKTLVDFEKDAGQIVI